MQTRQIPYEFMVRWDRDGRLAGAHVQFRYVTATDAGAFVGEFVGAAEPVAAAGASGFPLHDILPEVQAAALATLEAVTAERDALAARLAAVEVPGDRSPGEAG